MIDRMNPLTPNGLGIALPHGCSAVAIIPGGRRAYNGAGSSWRPFAPPRRQHRNDATGGAQHDDQPPPLQVGEQVVPQRRGPESHFSPVPHRPPATAPVSRGMVSSPEPS